MEENLKEMLKAENDVNKKVQDALNKKYERQYNYYRNAMLRSIKETSEKDINAFRAAKEKEYQEEY